MVNEKFQPRKIFASLEQAHSRPTLGLTKVKFAMNEL